MSHRARTTGLALGLAALLALSACGSSGSDTAATTTAKDANTTTTAPPDAVAGKIAAGAPVPSSGCRLKNIKPSVLNEHRTVPGTDRWYLLTTPADKGTPLPLVVDYHGLSEGAELHAKMSGSPVKAQKAGFIAVLPQGLGPVAHWDPSRDRAKNADLVFTDKLLDTVEAEQCVDTSRVYAMGLSNGAFMSSTVGCSVSDRFAAVAPVAGITFADDCKPGRPVPVLTFHGTGDPILLFNGGVGARLTNSLGGGAKVPEAPLPKADLNGKGYPAAAQAWATSNGCTGKPTDRDRTPTVIERTWQCPADGPVVFEIIKDGGHSWPGSAFSKAVENVVGPTDMSIDATDMIWTFFQRFQLPGK